MAIKLSKRLQAICDMVRPGSVICDVGCDHAHVEIYLLQQEIILHALAMDVADGPLNIARENLMLTGLQDRCEVRKSDGLENYHPQTDKADTLIIAGMGGILMEQILEAAADQQASGFRENKLEGFRELILSPHSEPWQVRDWLMRNGYGIIEEKLVEEDGKYYPILRCVPGVPTRRPDWEAGMSVEKLTAILSDPQFQHEVEIDYGPCLIADGDPTLQQYVRQQLRQKIDVSRRLALAQEDSQNARERLRTVQYDIGILQILLVILPVFAHE